MKKELKIAITATIGLVILFFGMNFLKGKRVFQSNDIYYMTFRDVTGVDKNTPIMADGVRIGSVQDITYDYSHEKPTVLLIAIDKLMRVPAGSSATISSDIMGNTNISLLLANNMRERILPGDTIVGTNGDGALERLSAMLPTIEAMAPKLDSILTSLNIILANPAIQATMQNAEAVSGNLVTTTQQLNQLLARMNTALPSMMDKADAVLDNAQTASEHLASLDLQTTLNQVNSTLASVKTTVDKLNSNEGTVGRLLNDPSLYDNLNSTMRSTDSLLIDLRQHPKRYVHFSIW